MDGNNSGIYHLTNRKTVFVIQSKLKLDMNLKLNLLKLYMLQVKYNHVRQNRPWGMMRRWFLTIQPFLANFGSAGPYYPGRTFLSNGDKVYSRLPFVSVLCGESFPFSRFPVFADFRFSEPMIYKFSPPSDYLRR